MRPSRCWRRRRRWALRHVVWLFGSRFRFAPNVVALAGAGAAARTASRADRTMARGRMRGFEQPAPSPSSAEGNRLATRGRLARRCDQPGLRRHDVAHPRAASVPPAAFALPEHRARAPLSFRNSDGARRQGRHRHDRGLPLPTRSLGDLPFGPSESTRCCLSSRTNFGRMFALDKPSRFKIRA